VWVRKRKAFVQEMIMMYDSRNPKPGVLVLGVPRPKINGLSLSQAKGRRTLSTAFCTFGAKPVIQPIKTSGGGLPPSIVICAGDTRSHNHRRRSPKMRAHNLCCGKPIPSGNIYGKQARIELLQDLALMYARCLSPHVSRRADKRYEIARCQAIGILGKEYVLALEEQVEMGVRHAA
jgi:hypothetical protein